MARLGTLSAKYESSGDAASVSQSSGDGGGWSYGIYQFASAKGVVQSFVQWLQQQPAPYAEYGNQLANAGDPTCDQSFADKWAEIGNADPNGFGDLQDAYTSEGYYNTGASILLNKYNFDIGAHSNALQQVLFSNCVQHGTYYGAEVFQDAANLVGQDLNSMSDHDIIYNIYEVKLTDMSWSSGSPDERPGLFARWNNERQDALEMLGQ